MSAIPEGYTVVPTFTDHLLKLAVPVPGRDKPILIEAPKSAWLPPADVEEVAKWLDPVIEAERDRDAWHMINDELPKAERAPFPKKAVDLVGERGTEKSRLIVRESRIRFLKAYLSDDDYETLLTSKQVADATLQFIADKANSPDITQGESEASTDS